MSIVNKIDDDGIIVDQEMIEQMTVKLSPDQLPDPEIIADTIVEMLELMNTDDMIEINLKDQTEFEDIMEQKFQGFATKYRALFSRVVSGEDLTELVEMLDKLRSIRNGDADMESVEKDLGDRLANKYIYSDMTPKQIKRIKKKMKKIKSKN